MQEILKSPTFFLICSTASRIQIKTFDSIICMFANSAVQNCNMKVFNAILSFAAFVTAHGNHDHSQEPISGPFDGLWYNSLPGDGGTQVCCFPD